MKEEPAWQQDCAMMLMTQQWIEREEESRTECNNGLAVDALRVKAAAAAPGSKPTGPFICLLSCFSAAVVGFMCLCL